MTDLNLLGCPVEVNFSSFNMLMAEIIIQFPKIKRFCKVTVGDQQKYESLYLAQYRWTKAEEERKRKEEEERAKAAKEEEENA